jgi:hypothetical protein
MKLVPFGDATGEINHSISDKSTMENAVRTMEPSREMKQIYQIRKISTNTIQSIHQSSFDFCQTFIQKMRGKRSYRGDFCHHIHVQEGPAQSERQNPNDAPGI